MTEQETIFQRPKTFADQMFSNMALYVGVGTRVATALPRKVHENLQGYRQMEIRSIAEMLGLRAKKIRTPLIRRTCYRPLRSV